MTHSTCVHRFSLLVRMPPRMVYAGGDIGALLDHTAARYLGWGRDSLALPSIDRLDAAGRRLRQRLGGWHV